MPLLLSAIPWRLVAIIGVVLGIALGAMYVAGQLKKVGRLEVENAQIRSDLEASKRVAPIVAQGEKKKAVIRHKADQRRKAIIDALPEDDGVLAPVLRRELDGLRPDPETITPDSSS